MFAFGGLVIRKTFTSQVWDAGGVQASRILQLLETLLSYISILVLNVGSSSCRG